MTKAADLVDLLLLSCKRRYPFFAITIIALFNNSILRNEK